MRPPRTLERFELLLPTINALVELPQRRRPLAEISLSGLDVCAQADLGLNQALGFPLLFCCHPRQRRQLRLKTLLVAQQLINVVTSSLKLPQALRVRLKLLSLLAP